MPPKCVNLTHKKTVPVFKLKTTVSVQIFKCAAFTEEEEEGHWIHMNSQYYEGIRAVVLITEFAFTNRLVFVFFTHSKYHKQDVGDNRSSETWANSACCLECRTLSRGDQSYC